MRVGCGARGERVVDVSAGEEARESPKQTQAADGRPADIFDLTVGGICLRRDHHFSAGIFAIAEGEEEAFAAVPFVGGGETMRKSTVFEAHESGEHAEYVSCFAPALEFSVGHFAGVGSEAEIQHVDEVDVAVGMMQKDYVARTAATGFKRADGVVDAAGGEVAQKGIAGAERQKTESGRRGGKRFGEQAVHNFVGRAVAADRQEISEASRVGSASERGGFAAGACLRYFQIDAELAHAFEGSGRQCAATSAARGGIDDGEEARVHCWLDKFSSRERGCGHSGTTASRPTALRICSASSARFTFMDAVRGKSAFQTR